MSLQALFSNASKLARFEEIARSKGYTVFTKRGGLYCLAALNDFANGYVAGQKELNDQADKDYPPLRIHTKPTEEQLAAFGTLKADSATTAGMVVHAESFKVDAA